MRLFIAQMNPIAGDVKKNLQKVLLAISLAKASKADLLVFPELALSGCPLYDLLLQGGFLEECEKALEVIKEQSKGLSLIIGAPTEGGFNSAIVFSDGFEVGRQHKSGLSSLGIYDERHFFLSKGKKKAFKIGKKKIALSLGDELPTLEELPKKIDLFVQLSASPWHMGLHREKAFQQFAKEGGFPFLFVNQVGASEGYIFDGASSLFDEKGTLKFKAESFKEEFSLIEENHTLPSHLHPQDELYEAIVLGIRDYFHKAAFSKAIIGISGGIDSSLLAYLACRSLGSSNVKAMILPSRFTDKKNIDDALRVAKNLHMETEVVSIEPVLERVLETLRYQPKGGKDLVFENLQPRIRALLLMAEANRENRLLIATDNKSEIVMGYYTLYGDSCGALAPTGDLLKEEIYALAHHINMKEEVFPQSLFEKAPSAELRSSQKDADDIPPYPLLDPFLRLFVQKRMSSEEAAQEVKIESSVGKEIEKRIFQNEYKRRQSPFILSLTEATFGSKRLFPLA